MYVTGVGIGQLFWGFLSGPLRPPPGAARGHHRVRGGCHHVAGLAQSFQTLLAWRLVHGLAAASAVVTRSVIRDLYSGRTLARVMSLTFVVFLMVPIIAPSLGQLILLLAPWRFVFIVFAVFAALVGTWVLLRLPETLHRNSA